MFCVVREFLEYFDLDFTISVYEPESYMGTSYNYGGKSEIIRNLGLSQLDENSKEPLLLELIRSLQLANNNNSISKNGLQSSLLEDNSSQHTAENDSTIRTEMSNANESNFCLSESFANTKHKIVELTAPSDITFDISNPKIVTGTDSSSESNTVDESCCNEIHNVEESIPEITSVEIKFLNKSHNQTVNLEALTQNNLLAETVVDLELSTPVLKESKISKSDKLKTKSNISSLTDLPTLQISRNRSNDPLILPSMYSHEFKEKTNLKEFDGFIGSEFDSLDNYEEDFMSTSDVELSAGYMSKASGSKLLHGNKTSLVNDCMATEDKTSKLETPELCDPS